MPPESRHQPLPLQDGSARRNLPRSCATKGPYAVYCLSEFTVSVIRVGWTGFRRLPNDGRTPERRALPRSRHIFPLPDRDTALAKTENSSLGRGRRRTSGTAQPEIKIRAFPEIEEGSFQATACRLTREKAFFPARFEPGGTVPSPRILPLKKVKCPILGRQKKRPILHAWANISTTLQVIYLHWRRGRDSNSWYAFNVHTISNRAPSTNSDTSPC